MPEYATEEWMRMRMKHPFFGEGLSEEEISEIWESSAGKYGDGALDEIADRITGYLKSSGLLEPSFSLIDIGCGPGTYSFRFAEHVRRIVSLDGSVKMLERLESGCLAKGVKNILSVHADWRRYEAPRGFDVAFSSLCPPLNCPEEILRMEAVSTRFCAYASSMNDDRGSIHMDIWHALGRDYTFNGYNTKYPYEFLSEHGREPHLEVFEAVSPSDKSTEEVVEFETEKFSAYLDVNEDVRRTISDVVSSHAEDGVVHYDGRKRLGLLTWTPSRDGSSEV